jgi:hypothetical protein
MISYRLLAELLGIETEFEKVKMSDDPDLWDKWACIITDNPIALDSEDHRNPRGALDQQGHEGKEFFQAIKVSYPDIKSVIDLGTGSGWFITNALDLGFEAYGIDGTDAVDETGPWYLLKNKRLFHADLRYPFCLEEHCSPRGLLGIIGSPYRKSGQEFPIKVDLITSWDVLEHMAEDQIDTVMNNIVKHLKPLGYFMGTIYFEVEGNEGYHTLCKPREWWISKFEEFGFVDKGYDTLLPLARNSPAENCFLLRKEK